MGSGRRLSAGGWGVGLWTLSAELRYSCTHFFPPCRPLPRSSTGAKTPRGPWDPAWIQGLASHLNSCPPSPLPTPLTPTLFFPSFPSTRSDGMRNELIFALMHSIYDSLCFPISLSLSLSLCHSFALQVSKLLDTKLGCCAHNDLCWVFECWVLKCQMTTLTTCFGF